MTFNEKNSGSTNKNEQNTETTNQQNTETTQTNQTPFTTQEWEGKRTKLQELYPDLSDEDLRYEEGKHHELYNRLQTRLGKTKDEVKSLIGGLSTDPNKNI